MTKKKTTKVTQKKTEPEAPATPTISFTEKEVQDVAKFVSYVHDKAIWNNIKTKEAKELWQMFQSMAAHCKKIDGYIFEFGRSIKPPEE